MNGVLKLVRISMLYLLAFTPIVLAQSETNDLNELLREYIDEGEPGMVVYVTAGDEAWQSAYGLANLDTGQSVATDDLFRIGSVTKTLVATVVVQLAQEGEVDLDAPIADYLPGEIVDRIENADTATVREMLQMTSGIYSYTESDAFDDATLDDPGYLWTAAEVIEYAFDEEANFDAGEDYDYSNTNYILAELLIEEVTGETLAAQLETRIFQPVGMTSCYMETGDRFAQGIVRGYQYGDGDDFEDITEINDGTGLGDGGVVCTAADLAKFLPALNDGLLLDDAMVEEMLDAVDDGAGGRYGLGIGYDDADFGIQIGHDGATSGFQSTMTYLPDEEIGVVVLTNNFDSEVVEDVVYDILDYMIYGWE